jgi:hypothetical protein
MGLTARALVAAVLPICGDAVTVTRTRDRLVAVVTLLRRCYLFVVML